MHSMGEVAESPQLTQGLGFLGAISVVAGTMIGTAIFVVPSMMLGHVGSPANVLAVWALAGILSLFGALGYAELGAAMPEAGGEYVYLRHAYGPALGFLYAWTQFVVAKSASIAAIATGFLLYLAYFFPQLANSWKIKLPWAGHGVSFELSGLQVGSALVIVLLSALNVAGVRRSGAAQTLFTAAKLLVLGLLIVLGFALGNGSFRHFASSLCPWPLGTHVAGWGAATIAALWAYDGWNNLSMVAGEVRNPRRNVPAALILGTLLVCVVYVLVNLAYFYLLEPREVLNTQTVAADAARRLMGGLGGGFVALGVLLSTFATLNGSILAGSRIPFAAARDGLFPPPLAHVSPRFRTPSAAILAQAVVAGLFALSGRYETLYTKAIYSEWVFYVLVTAGLLVLRRKEPALSRPYRTWGYPAVPVFFVLLGLGLLATTFFSNRSDAVWCVILIVSGLPVYYLWNVRYRRSAP